MKNTEQQTEITVNVEVLQERLDQLIIQKEPQLDIIDGMEHRSELWHNIDGQMNAINLILNGGMIEVVRICRGI